MAIQRYGRRQVLAASTGAAGACALAACSGGSRSRTQAPRSSPATGQALITLSEIPVGAARSATLDGNEVIVARPEESSAVAFSAVCTHQGCTVAPAENNLRCPCHGSTYETLTGMVLNGPAEAPLNEIRVRVENGEVVTA